MRSAWLLCVLAACSRDALPVGAPPGEGALTSACGFAAGADPTRAVLAFTVDHDLRFTFADGTTRTVYTFASQLPSPSTTFIGRIDDAQGDRVLADGSTIDEPIGQPARWASELVLLDKKGNVLWHQTAPGFGTPYLGADGTLAVWDTNQETLIVSPAGTARTLPGKWSPVAPAPDGSVLVQGPPGPSTDGHLGWIRPGRDTVEPLPIEPAIDAYYEEWVGGRLAFVGNQNGQQVLVLATPDESHVVALPSVAGTGLAIAAVAGDFLEVQRIGSMTTFRVDARSGAVEIVQSQAPAGLRRFDAGLGAPQLADDGSLLAGFRNDFVGSLYRSTDAGGSWAPLGFSVARVQGLSLIAAAGGTFVAESFQAVYAPSSPWSTPPSGVTPEVLGSSIELARPADGVRMTLPPIEGSKPVSLGSGGRCAAYWAANLDTATQPRGHLEILDVLNRRRTTVASASVEPGINPPLWLER